jgi:peroxisomal enoyl-CoA hydratase 2
MYSGFRLFLPTARDVLETLIWEVGPGPNGTVEIAFVCKNAASGKIVIANGVAHVLNKQASKL